MKSVRLGLDGVYFCRLAYGCDLVSEVRDFAVENKIDSGFFTVIGAVQSAVLGFYKQAERKYVEEKFEEPLEVVSCIGNVALKEGETFVHAHACLSREDKTTVGGHLVSARVFAGEVYFFAFKDKLNRKFDETTGLWLADLK
jgi:predicted DNA-binding protein with PD1-like motif